MDRRYPPLDPRSHSPDGAEARAMEAAERPHIKPASSGFPVAVPPAMVQSRIGEAPRAGSARSAPLTPDQTAHLMDDRRNALFEVLGTRMELANLLKERQPGSIASRATDPTEARAKLYFGDASDETLRAVDAHLRGLENYLRDAGPSAGGKYGYREFTAAEVQKEQDDLAKHGRGYAALHNSDLPHSVAVNYPRYSTDPQSYQLETQVHEWLHDKGFSAAPELYGWDAIKRAGQRGGTRWAINENPDNTAMFAVRRWPFNGVGVR